MNSVSYTITTDKIGIDYKIPPFYSPPSFDIFPQNK